MPDPDPIPPPKCELPPSFEVLVSVPHGDNARLLAAIQIREDGAVKLLGLSGDVANAWTPLIEAARAVGRFVSRAAMEQAFDDGMLEATQAPAAPKQKMRCPHCNSGLLWNEDRGAHCDGCEDFDPESDLPSVDPVVQRIEQIQSAAGDTLAPETTTLLELAKQAQATGEMPDLSRLEQQTPPHDAP